MDQLNIPFLPDIHRQTVLDDLDIQLDKPEAHSLDYLLWSTDNYKPEVTFRMAHNGDAIFLKITVLEDDVKAVCTNTNDLVYKDSCFEFFISFDDGKSYYNLEFNRIGTCYAAYARANEIRECLPEGEIAKIRSQSKLQQSAGRFAYQWQLTLIIPVTVFVKHAGINLNGLACKGNFYKCGDDLASPHFLAWSNIDWPRPNFHLPQFFGDVLFGNE